MSSHSALTVVTRVFKNSVDTYTSTFRLYLMPATVFFQLQVKRYLQNIGECR